VIGFLILFLRKTHTNKPERKKYIDVFVPAFLIAGIGGYLGAFLGGEIYGIGTNGVFSMTYSDKNSIIPFEKAFPLPLMYAV
jgi:prolipoprotein diacylglyceryltransferase